MKLDFPDIPSIYTTELTVLISDINYGNHLSNDRILTYCHETRIRFLKSLKYSEVDIEGNGVILSDAWIKYLAEGFHGDKVTINLSIQQESTLALGFYYSLKLEDGRDLAKAYTKIIGFNYDTRRIAKFSPIFLDKIIKD